MGIVVADSSALLRLTRLGQLDSLSQLCRQVIFPESLWKELYRETTSADLLSWMLRPTTPRVVRSSPVPDDLALNGFTKPQHEAIVLAALEKVAILTDDFVASREAVLNHVSVIGTLDVLNYAEHQGVLKFDGARLRDLLKQFGIPTHPVRERNVQLLRN